MGKNGIKIDFISNFHFIVSPPVCQVGAEKKKDFSQIACFFCVNPEKIGKKPLEGLELFVAFWYNNTH